MFTQVESSEWEQTLSLLWMYALYILFSSILLGKGLLFILEGFVQSVSNAAQLSGVIMSRLQPEYDAYPIEEPSDEEHASSRYDFLILYVST